MNYNKTKHLGSGGFGSVFLITHKRNGIQRACKIINKFEIPDFGSKMLEEV